MSQNKTDASVSEHDKLVRQITKQIHELGLITYERRGVFCKGFIPDIIINVGGTDHDWIIIDIINTKESLVRDIGGLLAVSANVRRHRDGVRDLIAVMGYRVRDYSAVMPLIEQQTNFKIVYPEDFKNELRPLMLESAREKTHRLEKDIAMETSLSRIRMDLPLIQVGSEGTEQLWNDSYCNQKLPYVYLRSDDVVLYNECAKAWLDKAQLEVVTEVLRWIKHRFWLPDATDIFLLGENAKSVLESNAEEIERLGFGRRTAKTSDPQLS